jgi:hypothetical protein
VSADESSPTEEEDAHSSGQAYPVLRASARAEAGERARACPAGSRTEVAPARLARAGCPRNATGTTSSQAAEALARKDYDTVLALTDTTSSGPYDAWLDYDRAAAFAGLERTDEAVEAYRRAEAHFGQLHDRAGAATALWGRARALSEAGRCADARQAFERYEAQVRFRNPRAAEMAAAYSGACTPR